HLAPRPGKALPAFGRERMAAQPAQAHRDRLRDRRVQPRDFHVGILERPRDVRARKMGRGLGHGGKMVDHIAQRRELHEQDARPGHWPHSNPAAPGRMALPRHRRPRRGAMNAPKLPLTVAIIARNAEPQLGPCLASVAFADEVLVLDSGSTDGTVEVARSHGARVETGEWLGFGRMKQHAVKLATHDWVLCLDADERVSERLERSIREALAKPRY